MAVSKSQKSLAKEQAKMDMTPMIDVVFLLLIFFMCTLNFNAQEGMLMSYLPKDLGVFSSPSQKKPDEPITVKLLKSGKGTIIWVGEQKLEGKNRFESLYNSIKYIIKRTREVPVVIDPDIDVPYQDIISVLNICRRVDIDLNLPKPIEVKFSAKALDEQEQSS